MVEKVYRSKVKKGDMVIVRSGKYKGHTGKVLHVYPKLNKITIEGVNVAKRHLKPSRDNPQGGIVDITKPIWISKVGIYDSAAKKPSRIGYKISGDKKVRIMKSSNKEIK